MMLWSETRKSMFKWNQYVVIYIDGEKVTDTVQVRDTEQYGGYLVDEMFGHNKVTRVMLVTPDFDPMADDDDEWEATQIKNELEHEIATLKERIERKERVGYFEGKRGQAMRRHYERKLANAEALHAELFGDEEPETPKVEGLGKAMQEAYDGMLYCYRKAVEAESFEAWYAGSEEAYAEKRAKRIERLGERSFELFEKDARKRYELALEGVVGANAPMGTVNALERRGLVKYDGMRRVKLLNV